MQPKTKALADLIIAVFRPRLHELTKRIEALEKEPTLTYEGTAQAGREYEKGMFVTHQGSLWHCNAKTKAQPGFGPAWTLAVKRGKDGRDAR